jgi:hypothetical protein
MPSSSLSSSIAESEAGSIKIGFMVAGVQKGGTTAMYEYLNRHPEVGMSTRKEPHFFDKDRLDWGAPDYAKLHRLYQPGHVVYGEATPITSYWKAAHERVHAYNPDMQFILLFRDPIERAYSHWCMEYGRGRESLTFADAIRSNILRRGNVERARRIYSYVERGFYAVQIDSLRRIFPKTEMLFLLTEELLHKHLATLAKVADFIGVDSDGFGVDPIVGRTRKSVAYPSIVTEADREWLRELYADDLRRFAAITGLDVARWSSIATEGVV